MLGEMNIDWVDGRRTSLACSFLIKFIRPENKIAFYYPIVNEFPQWKYTHHQFSGGGWVAENSTKHLFNFQIVEKSHFRFN